MTNSVYKWAPPLWSWFSATEPQETARQIQGADFPKSRISTSPCTLGEENLSPVIRVEFCRQVPVLLVRDFFVVYWDRYHYTWPQGVYSQGSAPARPPCCTNPIFGMSCLRLNDTVSGGFEYSDNISVRCFLYHDTSLSPLILLDNHA